jgi:TetR/AcrR family transcriptional regulator
MKDKPLVPRLSTQASGSSLDRIMAAAKTEFAQRGLRQTRIEDIARAAGVSQQLIFHYFEGKEALYAEVLALLGAESTDFMTMVDMETIPPLEGIQFIMESIFKTNLAYGTRFIADQILLDGEQIIRKNPIWQKHQELIHRIDHLLTRGRRAGLISSDIIGRELLLAMVSLSMGQLVAPTVVVGPKRSEETTPHLRDWLAVSLALVLTALTSRAGPKLPTDKPAADELMSDI